MNIDFDSEEFQFKVIKREKSNRSVTDVLMKVQMYKFKDSTRQFEIEQTQMQKRFEIEISQQDQHHKEIIIKTKEELVTLRM